MKSTRLLMGMPITVEIRDGENIGAAINKVFDYFSSVDERFSTYKDSSEISRINRGEIALDEASPEMQEVFKLSQETKAQTNGYFDIFTPQGSYDPSGLVKGWAIYQAAKMLATDNFKNFFIEAGGDIEVRRPKPEAEGWKVGIRNPFNGREVIKVLSLYQGGVATSGSYERGAHIYNPKDNNDELDEVISLTVVGPNVYEADRFATAAFAMGREGINFIERQPALEGYQIDRTGVALQTSRFQNYVA